MCSSKNYGLNIYSSTEVKYAQCRNWQKVLNSSHRLYRCSQPYYNGQHDAKHGFKPYDVESLKKADVSCIISANHHVISDGSKKRLANAGICFFHFKVKDYQAPRPGQLQLAAELIEMFRNRGTTLVYCGYGQGRTGTFVAAWAILRHFSTLGLSWDKIRKLCNYSFLKKYFGVEERVQSNAIRHLLYLFPEETMSATKPSPVPPIIPINALGNTPPTPPPRILVVTPLPQKAEAASLRYARCTPEGISNHNLGSKPATFHYTP